MTITPFNPDNKFHQAIFKEAQTGLRFINDDTYICAQYADYTDYIDLILKDIAINQLHFDEEIDFCNHIKTASYKFNPSEFGMIIGLSYIDNETEKSKTSYMKAEGQILIENDQILILDIDETSIDYSSECEFNELSSAQG